MTTRSRRDELFATPPLRRRLASAARMLIVGYLALALLAFLIADAMIFLPPRPSYDDSRLPITYAEAADGARIAVLHLPNAAARYTILYSHGNAEDLGYALPVLRGLRDAGFGVIGYDYRGYGTSTGGRPTTSGAYRDHEAAYGLAVRNLGISPERIILYGRSVGSGPATELAGRETVAGLVLESPFTSTYVVMTRFPILPFDRFPNLRNIRKVRAPVLIMHGMNDEVIPYSHGRRLYEAAAGPRYALWVQGARHNDVAAVAGARYFAALQQFAQALDSIGATSRARPR